MRLIPRGKPLYEELPTVFLNWEEMASKLRTDKFSGYIFVNGEEKTGVILFGEGKVSGALFSQNNQPNLKGQEALTKITLLIQDRKGTLSIYGTSNDICIMIEWFIEGKIIYSTMESYFIDYDKFMTIMDENKTSGLIKVMGENFCEFIYLDNGKVKGHFVDGQPDLQSSSSGLVESLSKKGTLLEVFSKAEPSSAKFEIPPITEKRIETPKVEQKSEVHRAEYPKFEPKFEPPKFEPIKPEPKFEMPRAEVKPIEHKMEPKLEPPKFEIPKVEPKPDGIKTEPPKPSGRPRLDFSNEDIDPFKPRAIEPEDKEAQESEQPPLKQVTPPTGATVISTPSGKIAFLLDGIRKVAQSNVGEDILPWLDGQITRLQAIQPNLSKRDLLLLVDEIERYVRTVRNNPPKAQKLSSQLRHIIESFAANLN